MKRCPKCHCDKDELEFYRNGKKRDRLDAYCKTCRVSMSRKWRLKNPGARKGFISESSEERKRWRSENPGSEYKRKYGLSLEQYNEMFTNQGGACAICNQPESGRKLCVDHDHATGEIRALLCKHCNTGLGHFLDREYRLVMAAAYLRRFSPVTYSQEA